MTTEEFAARKGCTARTVRRAIEAGLIPPAAVRRSGNPGRRQAVEIVALEKRQHELCRGCATSRDQRGHS